MALHQSLDQQRAKFAWHCVQSAKTALGNNFSDYVGIAKKMPATISQCGLGQALAFEASKDNKPAHRLILQHMQTWILHRMDGEPTTTPHTPYKILTQLSGNYDSRKYLRATMESQSFLVWLRMLAESQDAKVEQGENDA
jgi:CRISPR type III-B/RAMP module-associated protein Cmr5